MIKFEQVKKVYTGKRGCMCGCNGKYSIASHWGVDAANKEVGYAAHDRTNDRAVKRAVTRINKLINWNNPPETNVDFNDDGTAFCAWVDDDGVNGDRTVVVYFKDNTNF